MIHNDDTRNKNIKLMKFWWSKEKIVNLTFDLHHRWFNFRKILW